jgi:hypothetical protein
MVAANASGSTIDLPRRNERPEEQMAFGTAPTLERDARPASSRRTTSDCDQRFLPPSAKILWTQAADRGTETICVELIA